LDQFDFFQHHSPFRKSDPAHHKAKRDERQNGTGPGRERHRPPFDSPFHLKYNALTLSLERDVRRATVAALLWFVVLSLILTYPLPVHLADAVEDRQDALLNVWITAWD
jgi:hypothetical protein